jgi:tripartite-type tricarboxylate transporter receptor subunit TctC
MSAHFWSCIFATTLAIAAQPTAGQGYPFKPIRFIVSNAPGGAPDTMSRLFGDRLAIALGQPIIVENRPAAGGIIANEFVAKSAADGYTLLTGGTAALAPAVVPNLPYDPINDFAGIAPLANIFAVVITGASSNFKTFKDLVDYGRADPGKLNFGSAGAGSPTHLSGERLRYAAGFEAVHIPQKGAAAAVTEVMAGRLDYYIPPLVAALALIRSGKVLALAVPSAKRLELLPNVPTTTEAGVPNAVFESGVGMWAPKKTPREIVGRLNREVLRIAQTPEVRDLLRAQGGEPWPLTAEQFDAYIKADSVQQQELVKAAGIKAD